MIVPDYTRLSPGRTAIFLSIAALLLIIVHVFAMQIYFNRDLGFKQKYHMKYWHIEMLDLDEEQGFGTWFAVFILLMTGQILVKHGLDLKNSAAPDIKWWPWWLALGIIFHLLSIDEVAGMHEYVQSMVKHSGFGWTHVALLFLIPVGLSYIPFLFHLPRKTGWLFFLAGLIYVGGAVGVEHFTDNKVNSLHYNMWTTLEEGMEMYGIIIMIYALLDYIHGWLQLDCFSPVSSSLNRCQVISLAENIAGDAEKIRDLLSSEDGFVN